MENAQQLANRLREVILNGRWIANTNYLDQLADLSYEQANTVISNLNSIALLTFHINYYISGVAHFFKTGKLEIHDKYSFDMQPITSEENWLQLKNDLFEQTEQLALLISNFSDKQLEMIFVDEKYGNYRRNIEALIEHAYYHLGQITLIKKMVTAHTLT